MDPDEKNLAYLGGWYLVSEYKRGLLGLGRGMRSTECQLYNVLYSFDFLLHYSSCAVFNRDCVIINSKFVLGQKIIILNHRTSTLFIQSVNSLIFSNPPVHDLCSKTLQHWQLQHFLSLSWIQYKSEVEHRLLMFYDKVSPSRPSVSLCVSISEAPQICGSLTLSQHFSWHHQELISPVEQSARHQQNEHSILSYTMDSPNSPKSHNDQVSQSMAVVDVWLALLLILPPPPALSFQVHPFDKVKTATKTQTKTSPKLRHAQPNLTF